MEYFGETAVHLQLLFQDCHQHVHTDGNPDLRFHRVVGGAEERLDPQVLFDPLEEQLYLPAAFVELRDGQGWEDEIVGEEYESLLCLGVEVAYAEKGIGVVFRGLGCVQYNGLVAAQAGGFVDGTRRTPSVIQIAFGTDDKKSACCVKV